MEESAGCLITACRGAAGGWPWLGLQGDAHVVKWRTNDSLLIGETDSGSLASMFPRGQHFFLS